VESVDGDEDDPGDETEHPGVPRGPELKDELCGSEIGGKGHGVVEPIIPGEGEAV
jgi:hypothetical protein